MGFFKKNTDEVGEKDISNGTTPAETPSRRNSHPDVEEPRGRVPAVAVILGAVASIGGFMFGYESGQISGFLAMDDFIARFGENGEFSAVRQGTIVGLLAYVHTALDPISKANRDTVLVHSLDVWVLLRSRIPSVAV
jgi:SP family sugar:H+ symporter-like MFS transporter